QVAAALAAAHAKNIVHRDLKPDNVMIVADPEAPGGERAKILDFGIAKLASQTKDGEAAASQTSTGMMVGTPLYMSPEQCKGSGNITDKADVYSLGVMLYRMLAGRPPFLADGSGAIMAMHIYEKPTPIRELDPSIPEDLADLIHSLLAKAAAERPPMAQVVQVLEQLRALHSSAVGIGSSGVGQVSAVFQVQSSGSHPSGLTGIGQSQVGMVGQSQVGRSQVGMSGQSQVGMVGQSQVGIGSQSQVAPLPGSSSQPGLSNSAATTLGQSAAQLGPQKSRGALWAGLLAVGLGVAAVAFVGARTLRKPEVTTPPIRTVRFSIQSEPPGARVVRVTDHREIGKTPWTSNQPAGNGHLIVVLKLDGYAEKVVSLDQSESSNHSETLKPLASSTVSQAPPPPAPVLPEPTAPKGRGKKGKQKVGAVATAPAGTATGTTQAATQVTTASPVPTPKPPQPSKDESSHGRIQMVD
ncbi:MAG TPA: serine/threonine-protein kinase, partial [Pseudomonadota bacterium]|nr:serine/threonine-protein kinase [Pseudomonadota bacterium]